ncbi:MAG: bifunctional ADP-dependent NAD(P)H-hydrate dehydratase/NAD(P)H-hydrate epimerase [Desulfobulbus propionicus]|nr:MAG: bifunctional ADP-dependent NAD(P)H-hydrate dehydratase/NAD(P)H-hydrate epimerase [Desulfobulbus propionicus]
MQITTKEQMRLLDQQTIEQTGIPGMVLMENAGRGTVCHMERAFGKVRGKQVIVFVGPGNNGGDGLVIARTVLARGGLPCIIYLAAPEKLAGDAGANARIAQKIGIPFMVAEQEFDSDTLLNDILSNRRHLHIHSIVDAIFGIGLARPVQGRFSQAIQCINTLRDTFGYPVVAADIPSGLDSDTGTTLGHSVHADCTVTYGFAKPAHFHHGGGSIGKLAVVDIGIPSLLSKKMGLKGSALTRKTLFFLPKKDIASHKGSNGHLLILAGSAGKTGAAILCGKGSLRSGAGLVTAAVPHLLHTIYENALIEAMTVALPHSETFLDVEDQAIINGLAQGKNAIVLGPGIGTAPATEALVLRLYLENPLPMVIDADGLNILAKQPDSIIHPGGPRILTPHPGEMARLLRNTVPEIQDNRLDAALWLCRDKHQIHHPVITVLKGAGTVIAASDGQWAINTTGNPGMGTGGMGDVLAGMIGGLLAQGLSPWQAACLAVYQHGLCGDYLQKTAGPGFTATDVADKLPSSLSHPLPDFS